eukprot:967521-Alexandrium_andersonii.AAC.1
MAGWRFAVAFLTTWSFQWHRGLRALSEGAGPRYLAGAGTWLPFCARASTSSTGLRAAGLALYMQHMQGAQLLHAGP